ncbi:hypothetical protein Btru_032554 [Bulinus truncatus]|nr:hypothetical protein Btru_032554 [Bulinus truncatus]
MTEWFKNFVSICLVLTVARIFCTVESTLCHDNSWSDGVFPDPYDVTKYVSCHNAATLVIQCPFPQVFDPVTKRCMEPALAEPLNSQQTTQVHLTTTSPQYDMRSVCFDLKLPDGLYPNPESCSFFLSCVDGSTYHMSCPGGQLYNSQLKLCGNIKDINCQDNYRYNFLQSI